jgi:hypothetical protein
VNGPLPALRVTCKVSERTPQMVRVYEAVANSTRGSISTSVLRLFAM